MALTSPDNLWSPDPSDDYDLTVDLAAMQSSVQQAISGIKGSTKRGVINTNTNTQGFVTVTHGFSTLPTIALSTGPVNGLPDANTRLFDPVLWDVNSATFQVRFLRRDTNQWVDNAQAVVLSWIGSTA